MNQSKPGMTQLTKPTTNLANWLTIGVPPAVSLPHLLGTPQGAPKLWVLVLPLGFYRLPTESISLE